MLVCIKKMPEFHKNLQAQIKKQKCKAQIFNHPQVKYNLCQLCLDMKIFASHKHMKSELDLTCFQALDKEYRSVDEWYNAVQAQVSFFRYPQETANILHCDIFWFFLKDGEFVSKTINDSRIYLETFPASKVRQLAKKIEASKATVHHIKQVSSDLQVAQINLMKCQHTDLPPSKQKKQSFK